MICKNCGSEIPASAKFCDVCGTPVVREIGTRVQKKKKKVNRKLMALLAGLIILLIAIPIAVSYSVQHQPSDDNKQPAVSARVTPEQFNQIEKGMTYDEIKTICGSEGVKTYHDSRTVEYTWPGEYHDKLETTDPKLRITFSKSTKTAERIEETNILDGAEIYENERSHKDAVTTLSREEISNIPGGSSYESVCNLLGCEGILTYSMSTDSSTYKTYEWRYLSEEGNMYKTFSLSFVDNRCYR